MNLLEILGKIGFDWRMALANLANFLIIFYLLKKFAFKPIRKVLKERQDKINQGMEDAKKAAADLQMAEENYQRRLEEAKKEANKVIARASQQAKQIVNKAQEEAQLKGEQMIQQAQAVIFQEKDRMLKEVKKEAVEMVISATEKIIQEKLDNKKDKQLIRRLLDE